MTARLPRRRRLRPQAADLEHRASLVAECLRAMQAHSGPGDPAGRLVMTNGFLDHGVILPDRRPTRDPIRRNPTGRSRRCSETSSSCSRAARGRPQRLSSSATARGTSATSRSPRRSAPWMASACTGFGPTPRLEGRGIVSRATPGQRSRWIGSTGHRMFGRPPQNCMTSGAPGGTRACTHGATTRVSPVTEGPQRAESATQSWTPIGMPRDALASTDRPLVVLGHVGVLERAMRS